MFCCGTHSYSKQKPEYCSPQETNKKKNVGNSKSQKLDDSLLQQKSYTVHAGIFAPETLKAFEIVTISKLETMGN